MNLITHWINGKPYDGTPERTGPVFDPATGQQTKEVAFASPEIVDSAVQAAKDAFPAWENASLSKRTKILFAFRELVDKHSEDLAKLLVAEHGKVINDARGEIQRGLENIEFACGIGQLIKGEFSENVSTNVDSYAMRQPLGVVAGITPFNFPAMMPMCVPMWFSLCRSR